MKFRNLLRQLFLKSLILLSPLLIISQNGDPLIIKTKYGYVEGEQDKNNSLVWRGIPYAKAPIGDLRWKAPIDPDKWEGIFKTKKFGSPALQYHPFFKRKIKGDENCLFLNIWKPEEHAEKLPVYVWIHGGGNSVGFADQMYEYYGHEIAVRSQVIYVSINYRLGPFGWLSHPALKDSDNPKDNSGNFGTLDIIKALEWIQENIVAFGGDPNRVLIAGESAGAINIQSLLISPQAKGLFHAAISQSGFPKIGDAELSKAMTDTIIMKLLIRMKIAKTEDEASDKLSKMTNSEIKEFLYAQDAKDIMRSIDPYIMGMVNMPFIFPDGYVIPKEGYTVLETGKNVNKVPIIIGSNTNEIKLFVYFSREPKWKDPLFQITTTFGSNMWKAIGVDDPARKLSALADHPPVYMYLFNFGNPDDTGESPLWGKWGKKLGAHHGAEIKFFTGTDKKRWSFLSIMNRNSYKAGRDSLTSAMMTYAKNLLYYGDPNYEQTTIYWPQFNPTSKNKGLIFDSKAENSYITLLKKEFYKDSIHYIIQNKLTEDQKQSVEDYLFIFD